MSMPFGRIFAFILLLSGFNSFGQTKEIDSLFKYSKYKHLDTLLFQSNTLEGDNLLLAKVKYHNTFKNLEESFRLLFDMDTTQISSKQKAYYHHNLAEAYDLNGDFDNAANHYLRAQDLYKANGDLVNYNWINMDLYYIMLDPDNYNQPVNYLEEFEALAKELNNPLQLVDLELEMAFECEKTEDSTAHFLSHIENAYTYLKKDLNPYKRSVVHSFHAFYYTDVIVQKDSATFYYNKALEINKELGLTHKTALTYYSLGDINSMTGDYEKGIYWTKKANSLRNLNYDYDLTAYINEKLAEDYKEINQLDSAYFYLKQSLKFRDSLNFQKQNINLTRFEAEKKERQNLILEKENQKNQALIFGSLGAVALLAFLSMSVYINAKRKRLLVEKDKALKIKKVEDQLKEQELKALDAIVIGQEKERMRIASDLHDNIGSNFVAIKSYFSHLKKELKPQLTPSTVFDKTQELLEDIYQDIRSLAHLKHSGLMSESGLIPALDKLTKNVSSFSAIQVSFDAFIEEDIKLEEKLELNIFRVIQEAMANVVKHSEAKSASISITSIESILNIIIEDDGKGFEVDTVKSKDSIGLQGIKQRVQLLKGEYTIDSKPGRGTTIIFDIPI